MYHWSKKNLEMSVPLASKINVFYQALVPHGPKGFHAVAAERFILIDY